MSWLRFYVALLVVSDMLLAASIIVPWMILTGGAMRASSEVISPASIIWYAVTGVPSPLGAFAAVAGSIIYIGAALWLVLLSVPVIRPALRGRRVTPFVAGVTLSVALCGVIVLLVWFALPVGLELVYPFPDVSIGAGTPIALGGSLLAALIYILFNRVAKSR